MKVTREITFDSAHMLSNYVGRCHNLHGHTYKLQVTLEGEVEDETGMVVDFQVLDRYIRSVIDSYDHAIIFSSEKYREESENELLQWVEEFDMDYIICRSKCTAENIASDICYDIQHLVGEHYKVTCKLWETPNSFAEIV